MGRKQGFLMIYAVMLMHFLLVENHVKCNGTFAAPSSYINISTAATISEAPTPQPQTSSNYHMHGITQGSLQPEECGGRCRGRCSKTAFKKPCMFFCKKCCAKCLCVPPGTFGNKQSCPCYNDWKTKRGGPKCP